MKTIKTTLAALAIAFGAITANAQCMSYEAMCNNARFLTDRMAYEFGISAPGIIDDLYRINYDYICGVNEYLDEVAIGYHNAEYDMVCTARDLALRTLLGDLIWDRLLGISYFHRPIVFVNRCWHFSIYDYDRHGINVYFCHTPRYYSCGYHGGHFFHGMRPPHGHIVRPVPHPVRHGAVAGHRENGYRIGAGSMSRNERPGAGVGNGNVRGGGNANGRSNGYGNYSNQERGGGNRITMGNTRSDNNNRSSSRNYVSTPSRNNNASMSRGASSPSRSSGFSGSSRSGGMSHSMASASRGSSSHSGGASRGGAARGGRR